MQVVGKCALLLVCVRQYRLSTSTLVIRWCEGRSAISGWAGGGRGSRRRFRARCAHLLEKLRRTEDPEARWLGKMSGKGRVDEGMADPRTLR
jgi:hypothetical protein